MPQYQKIAQVLFILSAFNLVFATPVGREIHDARDNMVARVPRVERTARLAVGPGIGRRVDAFAASTGWVDAFAATIGWVDASAFFVAAKRANAYARIFVTTRWASHFFH